MASGEIEEGLEHLAQKRHSTYESKKESLHREIEQLRDFFSSMEKERELLECQVKATQALCRRKLVKAEKELQQAQSCLRETRNEAALLLEGKHQEMERLQKERDDCQAQAGHLAGEFDFFKGYAHYLEEKICVLVAKLHEYHQDLQKKTEEIVETRSRAVTELEWVKQSMLNFEKNLLEFHTTNTLLSSQKEHLMKELQGMKQLEVPAASGTGNIPVRIWMIFQKLRNWCKNSLAMISNTVPHQILLGRVIGQVMRMVPASSKDLIGLRYPKFSRKGYLLQTSDICET